jgi:hypothetical protein
MKNMPSLAATVLLCRGVSAKAGYFFFGSLQISSVNFAFHLLSVLQIIKGDG